MSGDDYTQRPTAGRPLADVPTRDLLRFACASTGGVLEAALTEITVRFVVIDGAGARDDLLMGLYADGLFSGVVFSTHETFVDLGFGKAVVIPKDGGRASVQRTAMKKGSESWAA